MKVIILIKYLSMDPNKIVNLHVHDFKIQSIFCYTKLAYSMSPEELISIRYVSLTQITSNSEFTIKRFCFKLINRSCGF